ncbi:MAG: hypothetical protein KC646_08150 [Candidatus Cloacimonetes bacterium]|nr:hypothetical protein [Candidatus Cloacimonadota bacterium]
MILNIHGYNSTGENSKFHYLKSIFPQENIISPTLPFNPKDTVEQLKSIILKQKEKILVVGSSLGGFYAYYIAARFSLNVCLINPSLIPFVNLVDRILEQNQTSGSEQVSIEQLKELRDLFSLSYLEADKKHVNVFVSNDDDVINHQAVTKKMSPFFNQYQEFETGGHRFEDLSLLDNYIVKLYENCTGLQPDPAPFK